MRTCQLRSFLQSLCHAKRYRVVRRQPGATNVSALLSLPDNVLHLLFDYLSAQSGTAGSSSRTAFNLAATCRILNEFYRYEYVVAYDGSHLRKPSPGTLVRALGRLPRVSTITLSNVRWRRGSFPSFLVGVKRDKAAMKQRALRIKSLSITDSPRKVLVKTECLRSIAETYRNLEHLVLDVSDFNVDDGMGAIAETLASSLQTLSLRDSSRLSDAGGAHVASLRRLKVLHLAGCFQLTDVTFVALSALKELKEFEISSSDISDEVACSIVPKFQKLRKLKLSLCEFVTCAIFSALPRLLVDLDLGYSTVIGAGVPCPALEGVPNLTSFQARNISEEQVDDLSFLAPVAAQLECLRIPSVSSDAEAAYWVSQMPNLVTLELADSAVADETAHAVSSLRKIKELDLSGTQITKDGVRALASGFACKSLRRIILFDCSNISVEDGSVGALSYELSMLDDSGLVLYDFEF